MNKCKSFKDLVKKKKIYKVPEVSIPLSFTPSIKILNQAGRSTAPTRDSQSYASSPHTARDDFRSFQASPCSKDVKIDRLLKESLKRFKSQKLELAKIKEIAEKWKKSRKKKIQDFNQVTRTDNKGKNSSKTTRARTAWESPDSRDRPGETPQMLSRQSGVLDRRANIGLEFYNLRSPRNTTPKNLQDVPKSKRKESQPGLKKEDSRPEAQKRKIVDFMKKKRKERIKNEKKVRENEEELEIKRLAQLMRVERAAKLMVKRKKKLPKAKNDKKNKKKPKKPEKKLESSEDKRKSFCYSEDEEVLNIMQVRKLDEISGEVNTGRQCMIFGDLSQTLTADKIDTTDIVNKIMGKRVKSQEISQVISSSMPIIELKSVSNESSSELSEKILLQRVEKMKNRLKSPEILGKPEKNPSRLVHSLQKLIRKRKKRIFLVLKAFETVNFHDFLESQKQNLLNSTEKRQELDEVLNKYIQSREISEDLEKIWEKIETNYKNTETEDFSKTFRTALEPKQVSESSIMETLKVVQLPSLESSSFVKPDESQAAEIDSPSLLSIVSESSENLADFVVFLRTSQPSEAVFSEPEPNKPKQGQDEILIEEGKSINEDFSPLKESSFIVTPESEEIEEFSSVNSFKVSSFSVRPFNVLDSKLALNEEEVIEGTIFYLMNFLLQEFLESEVLEDFKNQNYRLLGNSPAVIQDLCFFTSEFGIKQASKKLWFNIDEDSLKKLIFDPSFHLFSLGNFQEKLVESEKFLKKSLVSFEDSDLGFARIHNKVIFDLIDLFLKKIRIEKNPPPWKNRRFESEKWSFELIIERFLLWTQEFCRVCSGKIPTSEMILMDGSLDEDLLQSVREQGLERILFFDIVEAEPGWIDYDIEEKIMMFDVADMLITDLIEEAESLLE